MFLTTRLALLLFILVALPCGATDPGDHHLQGWIAAINSARDDGYRDFSKRHMGEMPTGEEQDWVDSMAGLAERHGALQLSFVAERRESAVTAYVHGPSTDSWLKVTLAWQGDGTDGLRSISIRRAMAPAPVSAGELTPGRVDAVLAALAAEIRRDYVLEDRREPYAAGLLERAERGSYRAITNRFELVRKLNEDLEELSDDKHLFIQAPDFADAIRRRYYSEEDEEEAAESHDTSDNEEPAVTNHGFTRAELLDGGIGYIEMSEFDGSAAALAAAGRIMTDLRDAEALVIDLRWSGGGDGEMVMELASYLFAQPTLLGTRKVEDASGEVLVKELWTTPKTLSARFATKPVYVLTGQSTASAAEALAFHLQRQGRARLIGAVTAGAGYMNDFRFLPGDFVLSISIGGDGSKSGWQGKGVRPDVVCPINEALERALTDYRS